MHIWMIDKWKKYYDILDSKRRAGIRIRFDKEVDPEVKRACKEFLVWLRRQYYFPIRVHIYVKATETIKAMDGDRVYGTFYGALNKNEEPYIRIATGDYIDLIEELGKDSALSTILLCVAHELTHYFQWVNGITLTEIGEERQAKAYAGFVLDDYKDTREHP